MELAFSVLFVCALFGWYLWLEHKRKIEHDPMDIVADYMAKRDELQTKQFERQLALQERQMAFQEKCYDKQQEAAHGPTAEEGQSVWPPGGVLR